MVDTHPTVRLGVHVLTTPHHLTTMGHLLTMLEALAWWGPGQARVEERMETTGETTQWEEDLIEEDISTEEAGVVAESWVSEAEGEEGPEEDTWMVCWLRLTLPQISV